jgi:hypothetical protein
MKVTPRERLIVASAPLRQFASRRENLLFFSGTLALHPSPEESAHVRRRGIAPFHPGRNNYGVGGESKEPFLARRFYGG